MFAGGTIWFLPHGHMFLLPRGRNRKWLGRQVSEKVAKDKAEAESDRMGGLGTSPKWQWG